MYVPSSDKQRHVLPSCFGSPTVNKYPSCGLFSAVLYIFVLFAGEFAIKVANCSAEVLSSVPKPTKAVMCLTEKIHL